MESPVHYAISKRPSPRHLTASQRAVISVDMKPMLREEARQRQLDAGKYGIEGASGIKKAHPLVVELPEGGTTTGNIRDIAGRAVGVSGWTVDLGAPVKEHGIRAKRPCAVPARLPKTVHKGTWERRRVGANPLPRGRWPSPDVLCSVLCIRRRL
jgi:hypothetical protein